MPVKKKIGFIFCQSFSVPCLPGEPAFSKNEEFSLLTVEEKIVEFKAGTIDVIDGSCSNISLTEERTSFFVLKRAETIVRTADSMVSNRFSICWLHSALQKADAVDVGPS
jgi:hypothetical protein